MPRQFTALIERTWNERFLFSALLELTYRCNLDCFYCYNDVSAKGRELSQEQYMALLDDLKQMGTMNLSLSGGEPLASPHFFPLGRKARNEGFVVRVKSNGHAMRPDIAQRVKSEIDPFMVEVSLHGAFEETHDRQTRVPGSFRRLMDNLGAMLTAGLRVQLNSTLTAWNENEIAGMFAIADDMAVPLKFDYRVTPRDNGDKEPLSISPSEGSVKNLLEILSALAKESQEIRKPTRNDIAGVKIPEQIGRHHCGAGSGSVIVDPLGNVYPCVQWRNPVGNLHEHSIDHIWSNSPGLDRVRRITREVKEMVEEEGGAAKFSGFCPALAEQLNGTPIQFDPGTKAYIKLLEDKGFDSA